MHSEDISSGALATVATAESRSPPLSEVKVRPGESFAEREENNGRSVRVGHGTGRESEKGGRWMVGWGWSEGACGPCLSHDGCLSVRTMNSHVCLSSTYLFLFWVPALWTFFFVGIPHLLQNLFLASSTFTLSHCRVYFQYVHGVN